jgi:eukaryotic-like serine/threonine-protein kinase
MKFKIEANTLKGVLIHTAIALVLFSVLSFTVFYKVLPLLTNKDKVVTVPDLKGMSIDQARQLVGDRQLAVEVTDSSYDVGFAPLTVLEQFPKPNAKVKVSRKIHLTLNARIAPIVSYPDLAGSTFDLAQKQLRDLGLKIGRIEYRADIAQNAILE